MFNVRPLSQQDPQWKEKRLGVSSDLTIGQFGCLLTSITMVANGLGYNETPASFNDKMAATGGFIGGLIRPTHVGSVFPGMRFQRRIQCNNPPAPLVEIDAVLASGLPVIVKVDSLPAAGMQDHWVVIYAKDGSDYLIQDTWRFPVETKRVTLTSRYGFAGTPAQIIKDILIYSGTPSGGAYVPPPPAVDRTPKTLPANPLLVYVTVDSLALRSQPLIEDRNILRRLPLDTRLLALDPPADARSKVGQMNVWLGVQVEGRSEQGFVAAWYVSTERQPPPPPPPTPSSAAVTAADTASSTSTVLFVTEDSLALRRQPVIDPTNLIRRLPVHSQLVCLDPQLDTKLGVEGQWLKVRDSAGYEGFVAAWYVSKTRLEPALGVQLANSTVTTSPIPDPNRLVIRTTEDRVALRSQPVISTTTLVKRLPFQSELLVIEPLAQAEKKIGVFNQWIQVRDINGDEGFVAAWYTVKSPIAYAI
jgi:hypothetical protein